MEALTLHRRSLAWQALRLLHSFSSRGCAWVDESVRGARSGTLGVELSEGGAVICCRVDLVDPEQGSLGCGAAFQVRWLALTHVLVLVLVNAPLPHNLSSNRCTHSAGSLQGEYGAGGRVHGPSRAAPPVGRHQLP